MAPFLNHFSSNGSWPKWQLALAIGTPFAVGIAYWYFKSLKKSTKDDTKKTPSAELNFRDVENTNNIKPRNEIPEKTPKSTESDPFEQAKSLKLRGNEFFKEGKYEKAIECYTQAIKVCPVTKTNDLSTFYQNRAAAYENLKNYTEVISDCSRALELNKTYIKALLRRAKAYEAVNELNNCLEDMTAVCILERFENMQSLQTTDRILKRLSKEKAKEAFKNHQPCLPSSHFIEDYFSSFKEDPVINAVKQFEEKEKANYVPSESSGYRKVLYLLYEKQYDEVIPACNVEIEKNGIYKAEALLARGTMNLLYGKNDDALEDFTRIISMDLVDNKVRVNALIKLGTLKMQQEKMPEALKLYEDALKLEPNNADIYMHRGQIHLLMDKIDETMADMEKSAALNTDSPPTLAQHYFVQYRGGLHYNDSRQADAALKGFEELQKKYSHRPEPFFLYAQILTEKKKYEEAQSFFLKAIQNDPNDANIRIHYGLLFIHWKHDIEGALKHLNMAIEIDPKCQFAYETLATIEVQRGNLRRGLELFECAIKLARTENELAHLISLRDAAEAQSNVSKRLGVPHGLFAGSGEAN